MDRIAGFERYLSITEENRLEMLHPPEKTPELFERYLPYAIALGVENRWAGKFAAVLAAAAADPEPAGQHDGLVCRLAQRLVQPRHASRPRSARRWRAASPRPRPRPDRAAARAAAASPAAAAAAAAAAAGRMQAWRFACLALFAGGHGARRRRRRPRPTIWPAATRTASATATSSGARYTTTDTRRRSCPLDRDRAYVRHRPQFLQRPPAASSGIATVEGRALVYRDAGHHGTGGGVGPCVLRIWREGGRLRWNDGDGTCTALLRRPRQLQRRRHGLVEPTADPARGARPHPARI